MIVELYKTMNNSRLKNHLVEKRALLHILVRMRFGRAGVKKRFSRAKDSKALCTRQ